MLLWLSGNEADDAEAYWKVKQEPIQSNGRVAVTSLSSQRTAVVHGSEGLSISRQPTVSDMAQSSGAGHLAGLQGDELSSL